MRLYGRAVLSRMGYTISRDATTYTGMEAQFWAIHARCRAFTRTPVERVYALYKATEYITRAGIPGDVVECGVWRGGSMMLSALTLLANQDAARRLYLFDTFKGLPEPGPQDRRDMHGNDVRRQWARWQKGDVNLWCYAPLEEVRRNMDSTGFPADRIRYVEGKVEDTLPAAAPPTIALLRLDTDWYESTRHELENLYPRLATGGVLIVDDVGEFSGAAQAFSEYFAQHPNTLVNRIDYTGRLVIKPPSDT